MKERGRIHSDETTSECEKKRKNFPPRGTSASQKNGKKFYCTRNSGLGLGGNRVWKKKFLGKGKPPLIEGKGN